MLRKPLGEARRLRYLSYICESLYQRNEVDEDFFIELGLLNIEQLNVRLGKHRRTTGIMQTHAVMRNYISFCKWLNLLKKERNILYPNSYTIYFASIAKNESFRLTNKEKISFFTFLLKKEIFKEFLSNLRIRSTPSDYIYGDINEHRAETFLEWCFDLGILSANSKKFGKYTLFSNYLNLPFEMRKGSRDNLLQKYFSTALNKNILMSEDIPEEMLWKEALISLNKTAIYTRSEIDNSLYSALPMMFDVQMEIVLKINRFIPFQSLVKQMEKIAFTHNSIFKWNYLADSGTIQLVS